MKSVSNYSMNTTTTQSSKRNIVLREIKARLELDFGQGNNLVATAIFKLSKYKEVSMDVSFIIKIFITPPLLGLRNH